MLATNLLSKEFCRILWILKKIPIIQQVYVIYLQNFIEFLINYRYILIIIGIYYINKCILGTNLLSIEIYRWQLPTQIQMQRMTYYYKLLS